MATPKKLRLSPSGPFITDAVSDVDLQQGPGSTGLIWRVQGSPAAPRIAFASIGVLEPLNGLAPAWALPAGYHYELQARIWIETLQDVPTDTVIHVAIQAELVGAPGVWVAVHNGPDASEEFFITDWGQPDGGEQSGYIHLHNLDYEPAVAVTGLRIAAFEAASVVANMSYLPNQSMLRAEQYVL